MWGYGLDRAVSGWGQVAGSVKAVMNLRVPLNARNFFTT